MVKRYDMHLNSSGTDICCNEYGTGDWVKYEDHLNEVSQLRMELVLLEHEISLLEDLLRET